MYFLQNNITFQRIQSTTGLQGQEISGTTRSLRSTSNTSATGIIRVTGTTGFSQYNLSFNYSELLISTIDFNEYFGSFTFDNFIDCYVLVNQLIIIYSFTTFLSGAYRSTSTKTIIPYINDTLETNYQIIYN
jgi:hypothetical protein